MGLWNMARDPMDDWLDKAIEPVLKAIEADPVQMDIEFEGPPGPPLSPDEIKAAQMSLAQPQQDPDAFKVASDALLARYNGRPDLFFHQSQLKFLHDAFVLARFACRQGVDEVRLKEPSQTWPDGFVRIADKTHHIEVTSTHGGRALGKEVCEMKGPMMDPGENWVARGDSIPKYLDEAVKKKIDKHYPQCWLVVYLNIDDYGISHRETEAAIAKVKVRYACSFEAISVIWRGQLY